MLEKLRKAWRGGNRVVGRARSESQGMKDYEKAIDQARASAVKAQAAKDEFIRIHREKLNRLAALEEVIGHLGLDDEALAAARKLISHPSSPSGVNVRIQAPPELQPVNSSHWPRRMLIGDSLKFTLTVDVLGGASGRLNYDFVLQILP